MNNLTIQTVWNTSVRLEKGHVNTPKIRDYISPSDLGKSFINRYYKMKGEPVTNDYDDRILRIFSAGQTFEDIVVNALSMAGLIISRGSREKKNYVVYPKIDGCLPMWGYYDFIMGGKPNWKKANEYFIERELLDKKYGIDIQNDFAFTKAKELVIQLQEKYGDQEIPERLIDVKSVNSMSFWGHNNRDENDDFLGYEHHKYQVTAYMLSFGSEKDKIIDQGGLFYISKDDLTLQETIVMLRDDIKQKIEDDIKKMSYYFNNNIVPPKDEIIIYDERKKKFGFNWEVLRSLYLTKIYGYKDHKEVEEKNRAKLNEINLALKHLRELNKETDRKKKAILIKKIESEKEIISEYKLEEKINDN